MDGSLDDLIKKDKEDRPRGKGQGDKEPPSKESVSVFFAQITLGTAMYGHFGMRAAQQY